jgi:hypothetical protein
LQNRTVHIISITLALLIFSAFQRSNAQFKVKGTVYDSSRIVPMSSVTVFSTAGRLTLSDSNGHYSIDVNEKDSIWFSYLGKPTIKYSVLRMNDPLHFDIAIQVSIPVLKEVVVKARNYRLDSIQNRIDYAKAFNFEKPGLSTNMSGAGVGFDLDEIIRMFQFRRNKMMQHFQQRLIDEEREKFIDHRFNKQLVRELTSLTPPKLDTFMVWYRPSYQFAAMASDYDFRLYIRRCNEIFSQKNTSAGMRKENN